MLEVKETQIKLPPYPTRKEVADALNAAHPERRHPFSERTIRSWQERGLITPHPAMRSPVRFDARHIADFFNCKFKIKFP